MNTWPRRLALTVLLAGMVLSALAAWQTLRANEQALQRAVAAAASQHVDQALGLLDKVTLGLRGTRGYFMGADIDHATQAGFRAYFESCDLTREFPGVMGLGLIRRVAAPAEVAYVAQARKQGSPDFKVRALSAHPGERRVIQFVEPLALNIAAIGLDIASEALRKQASDMALVTDQAVITGPIRLVQSKPGSSKGLLMLLRMPDRAGPKAFGIGAGAEAYVYAPIQLDQLLASANVGPQHIVLQIEDVSGPGTPVNFDLPGHAMSPRPPTAIGLRPQVIERQVMGRQWRFTATPQPEFMHALNLWSPTEVGAVGLGVSMLLALLSLYWARLRQSTAQNQAQAVRHQSMLDQASDAIIGLDMKGHVQFWNQAATRLFGFTHAEAMGRPLSALTLTPEHAAEDATLLQAATAGQVTPHFETQRQHRDGALVDVELSAAPIFDAKGQLMGVAKLLRPIQERLAQVRALTAYTTGLESEVAERTRQLAATERDLRNVLDAMPSMVGSWDRQLHNRFANQAYAKFFAREAEHIKGQSLAALLGPELFEKDRPMVEAVLQGQEQLFERDIPLPGGQGVRHTLAHYVPHRDGHEVIGFYVLVHDVTEVKQAQQRLANIIEGTQAGTWEWAVQTGDVVINEQWARMLGHTLAEMQPLSFGGLADLVHPDDLSPMQGHLQAHLAGRTSAFEHEFRMRHTLGHWVWVLTRGKVVLRLADGSPSGMAGTHQDISERKRVEQAVKASEAMLARTGSMAHVGGWELNLVTQEIFWSDETCRIHGMPPGHRPTLDEAVNFYAPEARPVVQRLVEKSMQTRQGWDIELPFVRADGSPLWVRSLGEVAFEGDQPVRLVGAFQDITAQRAVNDALRSQQALTQTMLDSAPMAVRVASLSGHHVTLVNERYARLVNKPMAEAVGLPAAPFYVDQGAFADIQQAIARGEVVRDRLVELHRPDEPEAPHVWALGTYMCIDYQGAPSVLAWLYDVSELQEARDTAQRAQALLLQALSATQMALAVYNSRDELELCNRRYMEMYEGIADALQPGQSFEAILQACVACYQPRDTLADPQAWIRQRLATHRLGADWVQQLNDGRYIRIIDQALPSGQLVSMRMDVSELAHATEQAQAASRAKSDFLASTSHEIRTPLNAILSLAYLLQRAKLPRAEREQVRQIAQAGQSLLSLVNGVLDLAKIEAGQMEVDAVSFNVRALVGGEMSLLAASVHEKGLETALTVDDDVPAIVVGDVTRMRQVLHNLLGNALKFTARGSVSVHVRKGTSPPLLDVAVSDTGIGISPEVQDRLFQPFEQADKSTTRRFGGTGLGLSITAKLVALMGGQIRLDSVPGVGSTFTVSLPLPQADVEEDRMQPKASGALRVLIAEDDEVQREGLRHLAEALGWQCEAVSGGQELVRLAIEGSKHGRSFDALVVDWQMPDLDGLMAIERLHQHLPEEQWPATVVITQHELSELQAAPHADLARSLLIKPVSGSALFNAVNESVANLPERVQRLITSSLKQHVDWAWLTDLRLLVVDDSALNLDVARKVLELEGAQVATCDSGRAALALLEDLSLPFDAVLLDVQMPEMDGMEVVRRIRQVPALQGLPVIALTAGVLKAERALAMAAGMSDFLPKPLEPEQLITCLRRHVELRRDARIPVVPRLSIGGLAPASEGLGIAGIDDDAIAAALRRDPALVLSMIRRLLAEFANLGAASAEELPALLHKLRGSAQVVGAQDLAEEIKRVEAQWPTADVDRAQAMQAALAGSIQALALAAEGPLAEESRRLAGQLEQENQAAQAQGVSLDPQSLAQLRELISQQSLRAAASVEELAAAISFSLGPKCLHALRTALQEFDFRAAQVALEGRVQSTG
jgi:two-component system sensor histidine kinase/response regulator